MEKLSQLKKHLNKSIPEELRRNMGAINPYLVPIYGRIVYYKRLKFCLNAIKKLSRLPKESAFNFVDVGCGFGIFMRIVGKEYPNAKIYGVDLRDEEQLKYGYDIVNNKNALFIRADALNLPLKEKSFDIVLTTDVLEHVNDPIKGLDELSRIMKDNSLLVILVPTELFLFKLLRRMFGKRRFHAQYHWIGNIKNVKEFEKVLKTRFKVIQRRFIPFPFLRGLLNYDLMYVCRK
ncbi:class I SAM-dependent methyltransferase [Candidatus Woesearchaeota archaeon]|nr:class I SAM-dependent methyltransferase [Candidatus Woesearchaeota archaeon]MBW3022163.1 class I SAM-dependent methyltransferase [Candidatus Woesearchaeota archaeon]